MKDLCYQITAVLFSSHQTAALVCNPQTIPFPASMPTLLPNFQTILPHFHFHFDRFTLKCGQSTCSCDDMTSHYDSPKSIWSHYTTEHVNVSLYKVTVEVKARGSAVSSAYEVIPLVNQRNLSHLCTHTGLGGGAVLAVYLKTSKYMQLYLSTAER